MLQKVPRSLFRLSRLTVPVYLREEIRRIYPALDQDPAYWRMFSYLFYGATLEEDTRKPLAHWRTIAEIEGVAEPDHHYNSTLFVGRFSRDVLCVTMSDYDAVAGRARVFESADLDPFIRQLIYTDLTADWTPAGRVYLLGGRAFTRARKQALRDAEREEAMSMIDQAGCDEEHELLEYLNSRSSNRFEKAVNRHWDEAVALAAKIESDLVAEQQFRILRMIRDQPVPFYTPSERTVRVFSRDSIANLKSSIRAVLCQDWTGADLRSAQLAICAADWPVPEVQEFLEAGGKIWPALFGWFGCADEDEELKAMFKIGLYGVIFGAGRDRVIEEFEAFGGSAQEALHFLAHPFVRAMWKARSARLRQIERDGGAYNCFSKWIACPVEDGRLNAPSVLAQLAQSRELQLLYPVLQLAQTTDEFEVVLWLHDGAYLAFKDSGKRDRWLRRIVEAVNSRARELGITTQLELK